MIQEPNPGARALSLMRMRGMVRGGFGAQPPAEIDPHHALASASPREQLNAMATAKAVAKTMQHLRQLRPYGGPH